MRISDWSSDVCSSDLQRHFRQFALRRHALAVALADLAIGLEFAQQFFQRQPVVGPDIEGARDLELADNARILGNELQDVLLGRKGGRALLLRHRQIGRASYRETVCQYEKISVVAGTLKNKNTKEK